jgi:glycerol-3-phosphate dehydrogenase
MLSGEKAREMEPEISPDIQGGIFIPRESLIDPFVWVVALAENAAGNGVKLLLSNKVVEIIAENGRVQRVITEHTEIRTRFVVNAAGMYGDDIARMVNDCDFTVHPRKGQFFILDRNAPYRLNHIVLPVPTKLTKGKLASPTPHGNILIGPTAEDLTDKEDWSVTQEGLDEVIHGVRKLVPRVSTRDAVTEYSGLRPTRTPAGYFIGPSAQVKGYIGATGIRSTGLTSSPAVAVYIEGLLRQEGLDFRPRREYSPTRRGIPRFSHMSSADKEALVRVDSRHGHVVCRCETVTEGQIVDAIHRYVGARSMDAIKRRLRAGMGRCQGGFCGPRVLEILSRELGIPPEAVTKKGAGSELIIGRKKTGGGGTV